MCSVLQLWTGLRSQDHGEAIRGLKHNPVGRMEFARYLLRSYDPSFGFAMPGVIRASSNMYDSITKFVEEHVVKGDADSFFVLKDARALFISKGKAAALRGGLEKALGIQCLEQKKIKGFKYTSVVPEAQVVEYAKNTCCRSIRR